VTNMSKDRYIAVVFLAVLSWIMFSCAPIEYTIVITEASGMLAQAEEAGAACTEEQLSSRAQREDDEGKTQETEGAVIAESGTEEGADESVSTVITEDDTCHAPFEFYFAREYLNKAREEVGYSDYQKALEFAQVAKTYAEQAYEIATRRRRERGR